MAGNAALAFGALVAGAVIIDYGVKNARGAINSNTANSGTTAAGSGNPAAVGSFPAAVNPVPGAVISRRDQGLDATAKDFLSPWSGHVVVSDAHSSGWKGGGYVAIQSSQDPNMVYYIAEGITPIVHIGDSIAAGARIAYPVANPYNGTVGNVEFGRANPKAPSQPLAQVVSNPTAMVNDFANWFGKLTGISVPAVGPAGHA